MTTYSNTPKHNLLAPGATGTYNASTFVQVGDLFYDTSVNRGLSECIAVAAGPVNTWQLVGGGAGTAAFAPRIVVGNSVNGDTAADCDYLDVGNGVQLQAALAAAGVLGVNDLWIRPGTYNLGAGAAAAPLTIPAYCHVHGTGRASVFVVSKASVDQGVFVVSSGALLENVTAQVAFPTGIGSGSTEVIRVEGDGTCQNCNVQFIDGHLYTPTEAAFSALRYVYRLSSVVGSGNARLQDCFASRDDSYIPSFRLLLSPPQDLELVRVDSIGGEGNTFNAYIDGCVLYGADIGVRAADETIVSNCVVRTTFTGFHISGSTTQVSVLNNKWSNVEAAAGTETGILMTGSAANATIVGNTLAVDSNVAGSIGISCVGSDRNVIMGNRIFSFATGMIFDATSDNNACSTNAFSGATTDITNSGTGNEIVHNIPS